MAERPSLALQGVIRKASLEGDTDFPREGVRVLAEVIMEVKVSRRVRADRYRRTGE